LIEDAEIRSLMMPMLRADFEIVAKYSEVDHPMRPWSAPTTVISGLRDWFVAPRFVPLWARYSTSRTNLRLLAGPDSHHYFIESRMREITTLVLATLTQQIIPISDVIREVDAEAWDGTIRAH